MKTGAKLLLPLITSALIFFAFQIFVISSVYAKQGCCSWHGGVSGCDTSVGRQVCNDGTYSPSCTCAYIPAKTTKPTLTPTKPPTSKPTKVPTPTPTNTPVATISPTETPIVQAESTEAPQVLGENASKNDSSSSSLLSYLIGLGIFVGLPIWGGRKLINKFKKTSK
jgi:hypothetical protein